MLSCPLKNKGINRQQPCSKAMQHTLDNLSSKAHAANIVFLFSIIQPSSLCPLPSGTMTSWDIITNQHELPVLCAVQITKKVFHNTPCFFSTRSIYFIHWFFQSCLWHWKSRMIPTPPHGRSPPSISPGPWLPFFFLLILMVIMEFLCLVSMHNGVINYVAIGVSSTQCVQPICASQRGGAGPHMLKDIHSHRPQRMHLTWITPGPVICVGDW